jgi:hypothetical protein
MGVNGKIQTLVSLPLGENAHGSIDCRAGVSAVERMCSDSNPGLRHMKLTNICCDTLQPKRRRTDFDRTFFWRGISLRVCVTLSLRQGSGSKQRGRGRQFFTAAGTFLPRSYLETGRAPHRLSCHETRTAQIMANAKILLLHIFVATSRYCPSRCLAMEIGILFL